MPSSCRFVLLIHGYSRHLCVGLAWAVCLHLAHLSASRLESSHVPPEQSLGKLGAGLARTASGATATFQQRALGAAKANVTQCLSDPPAQEPPLLPTRDFASSSFG